MSRGSDLSTCESRSQVDTDERGCVHELPTLFAAHGLTLATTLADMLHEHFLHRTERRGCGFTQATRFLAALVNQPRPESTAMVAALFPALFQSRAAHTTTCDGAAAAGHDQETALRVQQALRGLVPSLEREESRLLAAIIIDLVSPAAARADGRELSPYAGELKIGTCPLAEKYFLEISHGFVRRKGRVNVLVSASGEPLLIEKINLGDSNSCMSVAELVLNGVRLPPGCLFGVRHDEDLTGVRATRTFPGEVIPIERCTGFRFLRLTTLAVSPQHRARAFTSHFESQVAAGLYAPGQVTIAQVRRVAEEQL